MHFLWRLPDDDHDFPARMAHLKGGFTRRLPESVKSDGRRRERRVWQARYWEHVVRNDDDLARHIDCIHFNPVKHGLAPTADDWPYSTWADWKKEFGRPLAIPPADWKPLHLGERS